MLAAFGCCYREKKNAPVAINFSKDTDTLLEEVAIDFSRDTDTLDEAVETSFTTRGKIASTTGSKTIDYDFLAPSVHHLQTTFFKYVSDNGFGEDATVYDIENLRSEEPGLIRKRGLDKYCPIDGRSGAAYVQCIEGDDHVGIATHMISYAWGYKVGDIVETLVSFCKTKGLDPKRTYIWICCLCNNQHRVVDRDVSFEEFRSIFNKRVKGIGQIIAMMAPWNNPAYLKRVWCVFEMFEAYTNSDCTVQIAMPPKERESLIKAITEPTKHDGKNGVDELFAALAKTKVENADASRQSDKDNILRLVEDGPGCYKLNMEVNHLMRTWVRETVFDAVKEMEEGLVHGGGAQEDLSKRAEIAVFVAYVASYVSTSGDHAEALKLHQRALRIYEESKGDTFEEERARTYNNLGTEFESLGQYESALEQHEKCLAIFEKIFGTEHENTSTSYFNIGAVRRKLGDLDGALEMYNKSIAIDEIVKGTDHIDTALGYSYVGRIYMANEDYDGALEIFMKSLRIRKNARGDMHPDVAIGLGDLGLIYHMKKDYENAIKQHRRAMQISESLLGTSHPDTGSCYQNLGGALYEQGNLEESLVMCEKAVSAYKASFGPDHPKTGTANAWLNIVNDAIAAI